MQMNKQHTVRAFEEALSGVRADLLRMGQLTGKQLAAAAAFLGNDSTAPDATAIDAADNRVDDFEARIEHEVQQILALRQPMANDLRSLLSFVRMATDLERIADHAKNIAKRVVRMHANGESVDVSGTQALAARVQAQLAAILEAVESDDVAAARAIWSRDAEIDALFEKTFNDQLLNLCRVPDTAVNCTHLLFIDKSLERIGDHVTNVAEDLVYKVTGERMQRNQRISDSS